MKRLFTIMAVFIVALAGAGLLLAQGTDPFVGTWKLNLAKSKFTNTTTPKSETRTIEAQGGGRGFSTEGIASDGNPHLVQLYEQPLTASPSRKPGEPCT